ncbi:putative chemoreceptor glutamine deamidase CheD 2 [Rubrivivax sp. A210]|uniref:chemotaxis protein CheD n=1 Tax=Rubrivivax sp. A210 TaxID=2772301 RepID=UPI001917EE10|nr:chemotaxis protein CheD [Rubrivivax sp. A210]CAD5369056.1 putative chemoreceptor glutamine deamidase CheD 2 [Rubrivivax sp. A210]
MSANEQIDVFLQPGDLFVADAGYRIRTMLGSCVSITLWHPLARVGGMSHFLLPTRGSRAPGGELDGRYGDEALQLVLRDLRRARVPHSQCQAKIFGGGNMFPGFKMSSAMSVGQRNGEAARELLRLLGIPVVSESLFGDGHRQVIFDIASGDVWLQQVTPTLQDRQT